MTKHEQIRAHLRAISRATMPGLVWNAGEIAFSVQQKLDAIRRLTQEDEPESLAGSVLRLTNICNELGAENRRLKRELLLAEGNLTMFKKRNSRLEQNLATVESLLHAAEQRVKSLRATYSKVMANAGVTELRANNVRLLRRNKGLEQALKDSDVHTEELQADIAKQNKYIELLKRDRRECKEQATNESYIESLRQRLAHKHRTLAQVCNQVQGLQRTLEDTS